jgi:general stress protein YciG
MEVKFVLSEKKKGQMSVAEAGRKGGQKGGRRTAETHGREFYEEIGHKGGQKVRRLIQEGKQQESK